LSLVARPSPQTERLITIVEMLSSKEELTLSQISRDLAVTPATCHPMLTALVESGWLTRHPVRKTFRLGPALVPVGRAAARGLDVLDAVRPAMERLRNSYGLTCYALTPGEAHVTIAEVVRFDGPREPHMRIGDQAPIAPPLGIGYVPWADEQTLKRWLDQADDEESRTRMSRAVDDTRARGYAVELVTGVESSLAETLDLLDRELEGPSAAKLRSLIEDLVGDRSDIGQLLELDPAAVYRVGGLSAPVLSAAGELLLILGLRGFGPQTTGARVEETGQALAAAASAVA
jgi:DNA-binding IclR family transcriptional regulator